MRKKICPYYLTSIARPGRITTSKKILDILQAIKEFPIDYFVIDAGWYKPIDKGWGFAVGDWNENKSIFPHGLKAVVKKINTAGMKAGIWYEYEMTGKDSEIYHNEEFHLTRGGKAITTTKRRFLDLRKEEVQSYLQEKVIKPLKENGFEYLKIDYNDAFSYCDGAESLGEGGRQAAEASVAFLDKLKKSDTRFDSRKLRFGGEAESNRIE